MGRHQRMFPTGSVEVQFGGGCLCGAGGGYTAGGSLQPRASNRHRQLGEENMVISQQLRGHPAAAIDPTLREIVVVVPAHNERDRLPACLASVAAAADQVAVPVTVVVVLDACSDRSEDAIARPVRALSVSGRNVGAARAAGFAAAAPRSDARTWLATTDADSVVPTTWLADQAVHHRALVQGVVGTVSVDWQQHSATTRRRYDRLYRVGEGMHGHVHGANLGVRADAYWRVGGFRPLHVGEDVDLVDRLVEAGALLAWDAHNAVLTSDRRDCRARGGFGDYVRSLAEDGVDAAASAGSA
jgi:glycosyltransferase involved in cell wall biosynthesis